MTTVSHRQSKRILVVEDNEMDIKVTGIFLNNLGYDFAVVNSGKDALDSIREGHYDLVLMDVEMPEMDGLETTRRIRSGEAGEKHQNIPVVGITAHAYSEFKEECVNAGMDDYISKPFHFNELSAVLAGVERRFVHKELSMESDSLAELQILNHEWALNRIGGREEHLQRLYGYFLQSLPETVNALEKTLEDSDFEGLAREAHALKGATGIIGAERSFHLAERLEEAIKRSDSEEVRNLTGRVIKELERVGALLSQD